MGGMVDMDMTTHKIIIFFPKTPTVKLHGRSNVLQTHISDATMVFKMAASR
jgi:hypothetical protein